jgi:hypothetical protein
MPVRAAISRCDMPWRCMIRKTVPMSWRARATRISVRVHMRLRLRLMTSARPDLDGVRLDASGAHEHGGGDQFRLGLWLAGGTYPYHYVLAHTGAPDGFRSRRPPATASTTRAMPRRSGSCTDTARHGGWPSCRCAIPSTPASSASRTRPACRRPRPRLTRIEYRAFIEPTTPILTSPPGGIGKEHPTHLPRAGYDRQQTKSISQRAVESTKRTRGTQ